MWNRIDLKARGKAAFTKNYWTCLLIALIMGLAEGGTGAISGNFGARSGNADFYFSNAGGHASGAGTAIASLMSVILAAAGTVIVLLLFIFALNVLVVGGSKFFVRNQTEQAQVGLVIDPFKSGQYGNVVLVMFLKSLFVTLWSLLFIIPGVIKSYEYRMIPYILAENPGMDRQHAFEISKRMMDGKKWETFVLDLSFIGWHILSLFTCGILEVFYVAPYVQATNAEIYSANREIAYQEGFIK